MSLLIMGLLVCQYDIGGEDGVGIAVVAAAAAGVGLW